VATKPTQKPSLNEKKIEDVSTWLTQSRINLKNKQANCFGQIEENLTQNKNKE